MAVFMTRTRTKALANPVINTDRKSNAPIFVLHSCALQRAQSPAICHFRTTKRVGTKSDLRRQAEKNICELFVGLSENPKSISSKFLYDKTGCELFDQICCLDEYYPTRTEMLILRDNVAEICTLLGPECRLIELGSGSSAKTRVLLDHLYEPAAYVPIDIARDHLLQSTARLACIYPKLRITPVCADFTSALTLPEPPYAMQRTVAFFPGSTIG